MQHNSPCLVEIKAIGMGIGRPHHRGLLSPTEIVDWAAVAISQTIHSRLQGRQQIEINIRSTTRE